MREQRTLYILNRNVFCVLAGLALCGFLAMPSMSFAESGQWVPKSNMPTARHGFGIGLVNGRVYTIGGGILGDTHVDVVEEYDPETDTWTRKTDMPTKRRWLSASMVDGRIYAIGGVSADFLPTVEEYDPVADTWTRKADMPTARNFLSSSIVDGKIYAIGGTENVVTGPQTPITEEYTPEGWPFSAVSPQGKVAAIWGQIKCIK